MFISIVFSAPLLLNAMVIVVCTLQTATFVLLSVLSPNSNHVSKRLFLDYVGT